MALARVEDGNAGASGGEEEGADRRGDLLRLRDVVARGGEVPVGGEEVALEVDEEEGEAAVVGEGPLPVRLRVEGDEGRRHGGASARDSPSALRDAMRLDVVTFC